MKHLAEAGFTAHTFENNLSKKCQSPGVLSKHMVFHGQTLNFWMVLSNQALIYLLGLSLISRHTLSYSRACERELLVDFSRRASLGL